MTKRFLITGGAGFIGSAVVRHLIGETDHRVCVVDKLTYAGNLDVARAGGRQPALLVRARRHRRRADNERAVCQLPA